MLTGGKVVIPVACRGVGLTGGNACRGIRLRGREVVIPVAC